MSVVDPEPGLWAKTSTELKRNAYGSRVCIPLHFIHPPMTLPCVTLVLAPFSLCINISTEWLCLFFYGCLDIVKHKRTVFGCFFFSAKNLSKLSETIEDTESNVLHAEVLPVN